MLRITLRERRQDLSPWTGSFEEKEPLAHVVARIDCIVSNLISHYTIGRAQCSCSARPSD